MCNGGPLDGLVDSFSKFQMLRNYNRLVTPTDLAAQYYNLAFVKEFDRNNLVYSTLKPVDLILANSGAPSSLQSYHSNGFNSNKQSSTRNIRSAINKSPSRTAVSSTCPPTPPAIACHPKISSPFHHVDTMSDRCAEMEYGRENDANNIGILTINNSNGGAASQSSIEHYQCILNRRQRGEKRPIPDEQKDEKYFERRKRNNEAAKKSRDARKMREDRIAFRAAILEQENAILRAQILALREEVNTLQQMICSRPSVV